MLMPITGLVCGLYIYVCLYTSCAGMEKSVESQIFFLFRFENFAAFGIRRRPNYAILRGTASDFTYGSNFATAGASARNSSAWVKQTGFNTPFSLEVQLQWLVRYKVRLGYYYNQNPVSKYNYFLLHTHPCFWSIISSCVSSKLVSFMRGYIGYEWSTRSMEELLLNRN